MRVQEGARTAALEQLLQYHAMVRSMDLVDHLTGMLLVFAGITSGLENLLPVRSSSLRNEEVEWLWAVVKALWGYASEPPSAESIRNAWPEANSYLHILKIPRGGTADKFINQLIGS